MRVGHGKVTSLLPLTPDERQVATGLSVGMNHSTENGGFSRSLRRKAPSVFDAPARTGPEETSSASRCLAHPVEEKSS